jgi:DNA-binding response OmpR family regulator
MSTERESQRTIFLVEEDDQTRPLLRRNLKSYGYRVIVALDEEDALERVGGGRVPADLVLVNLVGESPEEALSVGRRVREHAKFDGHTPVIVMAEKYGPDLEGTDVNCGGNDWITYLADGDQLRNLIERLMQAARATEF